MFQAFDDIMDHSNVHCIFPKLALGVKHATFFFHGPNYMVCTHVGCSHKGFLMLFIGFIGSMQLDLSRRSVH